MTEQELREAIVAALRSRGVWWADDTDGPADTVLALPELVALRAKAAAADRVRAELARRDAWLTKEIVTVNGFAEQVGGAVVDAIRDALDDPC